MGSSGYYLPANAISCAICPSGYTCIGGTYEFNPDIFVMGGIYQAKNVASVKETEPYNTLDAVKNNKIYTIPMGLTQMEQLNALSPEFFYDQANRLYPDIFSYDVKSMIKASVKEYFGTDLSDKQVEYMLNGLNPEGGSLY